MTHTELRLTSETAATLQAYCDSTGLSADDAIQRCISAEILFAQLRRDGWDIAITPPDNGHGRSEEGVTPIWRTRGYSHPHKGHKTL